MHSLVSPGIRLHGHGRPLQPVGKRVAEEVRLQSPSNGLRFHWDPPCVATNTNDEM